MVGWSSRTALLLFLALIGFVGAVIAASAQPSSATTITSQAAATTRVFIPYGARAATFETAPTVTPEAVYSTDLIAEAEAAGTISTYQATLYRLQALVGDSALPAQFAGSTEARMPSGHVANDALALLDSLPSAEQDALRPYIVRPNHSGSYYQGGTQSSASRSAQTVDRPRKPARYESAANGRIWVWADPSDHVATYTAERIADILGRQDDKVLAPIEQLMGVTWTGDKSAGGTDDLAQDKWYWHGDNNYTSPNYDERLDIYVVPLDTMGVTVTGSSTPSASYVLIDEMLEGEALEYSVRHELFHVIQYRFKLNGSIESLKWWLEPTADWSVTHFTPSNSFPYKDHVPHYLDRPRKGVDLWGASTRDQLHAYGAFGWPTAIDAHAGGGTGAAIRDVFNRMSGLDPVQAIKGTLAASGKDVAEIWRDFAVANLNTDYVRQGESGPTLYGAWNPFLDQKLPEENIKRRPFTTGGKSHVENTDLKVSLERFGSEYYSITFADDVRQVLFRLEDWTKQTGNGVIALKRKKGEQWSQLNLDDIKEDWSEPKPGETENWRYLCRDKKDENLEELILVFTNADPDAAAGKEYSTTVKAELSNVACRWKGTVTLQEDSTFEQQWFYTTTRETSATFQLSNVVFETQVNGLDSRPAAFVEQAEYEISKYAHVMPVLPTSWDIQYDETSLLTAAGEQCRETTTGGRAGALPSTDPPSDQDMFAYPFLGEALSLVIWGDNYNNFSLSASGDLEVLTTSCDSSTPDTRRINDLWIGHGPATTDEEPVRTVSVSGDRISATREKTTTIPPTCESTEFVTVCVEGTATTRTTIALERFPEQ